MNIKISDLSKATRNYFETQASKAGISAAQLLRHFDEIISGRKVSIHSRLFTGQRKDFSCARSV